MLKIGQDLCVKEIITKNNLEFIKDGVFIKRVFKGFLSSRKQEFQNSFFIPASSCFVPCLTFRSFFSDIKLLNFLRLL